MSGAHGPDQDKGQPDQEQSVVRAALLGSCPRCGGRTLFEAPARVALSCSACALDFGALERGGRRVRTYGDYEAWSPEGDMTGTSPEGDMTATSPEGEGEDYRRNSDS